MGFEFSKLVPKNEVTLTKVKYKKVAVTTYSEIYDLLKGKDQTTDSNGNKITHITGMFDIITNLAHNKLKPCFVLDGKFPEIKRHQKIINDVPPSRVTSTISKEVVDDIKKLIDLCGMPIVQAPTEEAAQAAHLCQKEDVAMVVSKTWDPIIFGADKILLKGASAKQKKVPRKKDLVLNSAQLLDSKSIKKKLKVDHDQMIILAMLLGTKFNPGVVGMTQKQTLHLVNKWKEFPKLFKYAGWNYSYTWKEVYDCIKTLPVTNKYKLKWNKAKKDKLAEWLVDDLGMSAKKVENRLAKLQ